AALAGFAAALGKTPVVVKDSPGFLVNRVLMPYLAEAVCLVSEGVEMDLIDHAMRRFGMPMGPLELLDQVGLDVAAHIARSMQPLFARRWQEQPALQHLPDTFEQLQRRGWLGQKSGLGFYRYRGKKKAIHRGVLGLLPASAGRDVSPAIASLPRAGQVAQ